MKALVIVIYWCLVIAIIALLLALDQGMRTQTGYDMLRLVVPITAIGIVFGVEKLLGLHVRNFTGAIIRRCMAAPFLLLGLNWLCIFTLTDYRVHRRLEVLPLAVVSVALGLALVHMRMYAGNNKAEQRTEGDAVTNL